MKKIAVISPHLLPQMNGVSFATDALIKVLNPILVIGSQSSRNHYENFLPLRSATTGKRIEESDVELVLGALDKHEINMVFVVCWNDWADRYIIPKIDEKKIKIIFYSHGVSVFDRFFREFSLASIYRILEFIFYYMRIIKKIYKIIIISQSNVPTFWDSIIFAKEDKFYVCNPPSLDLEKLKHAEANLKVDVLYCANYTEIKRWDRFIDLAKLLPNFQFVGIGSSKNKIYENLNTNLPGNCMLMIDDGSGVKEKLYKSAKTFVVLSDWEASPLTVIDAISCGIPIFSFPVGELKHLKDVNVYQNLSALAEGVHYHLNEINHAEVKIDAILDSVNSKFKKYAIDIRGVVDYEKK